MPSSSSTALEANALVAATHSWTSAGAGAGAGAGATGAIKVDMDGTRFSNSSMAPLFFKMAFFQNGFQAKSGFGMCFDIRIPAPSVLAPKHVSTRPRLWPIMNNHTL